MFEILWPAAGNVGDVTPFTVTATDSGGASADLNLGVVTTGEVINRSHLGTDFWLGFGINFRNTSFGLGAMPLDDPGRSLQIAIGAPEGAFGTVEIAGLGFVADISVQPGDTQTIDIPNNTQVGGNGTGANRGVQVTTDRPVTVVGINWAFATTDAFLALPTPTLGTDYVVTGFKDVLFTPNDLQLQWMAVATQDNTTITMTPIGDRRANITNVNIFDPQTATINRGEVFTAYQSSSFAVAISADAPIAAFAGASCADVPTDVDTCDHVWQQFVPDRALASRYLAAPIETKTASMYRIVATEDNTRVFFDGTYVALLNNGQKLDRLIEGPVEITGSRPIVAVQYATGFSLDEADRGDQLTDPFMLALAPVDTFLSDYTFVVPSGEGVFRDQPNNIIRLPVEQYWLSLVIPAEAVDSLFLDDALVDTATFEPIGTSNYLAGTLAVTSGTHRIAADEQFGVTVYAFGLQESYGFYAGLIVPDALNNLNLLATGPTAPLIAGTEEACFDIEVRDLGGALQPRTRFQVDITGTNISAFTGFTDQTGRARYCYTQSTAGTDLVDVSINGDNELLSVEWLLNTDPTSNGVPEITSFPELILYEQTFDYPITYTDPDGDVITLSLAEGPNGVTFVNDILNWTPPIPADRQPTTHFFTVVADDGSGGTDEQRFELTVYYPAIFVPNLPSTRGPHIFSGAYESTFNHLGGDPFRLVAEMADGPGTVFWAGILGTTPVFNIDGREQFINTREYTFVHNLMCRSEGVSTGQFSLRPVWEETGTGNIRFAVGGPVYDSNSDGLVTDADDIYAVLAETDDINLYDLTTRQIVWQAPIQSLSQFNYLAMANLDGDSSQEILAVVGLVGDTQQRLTAFDDDGSVLWRSGHYPFAAEYTTSTWEMPILAVDLENDGTTEILLGPYVYDNLGNLIWQFDDTRIGSTRPRHALPMAIDLDGDGAREVLFQTEVRDTDGTLLWSLPYSTTTQRPRVFFAVGELDDTNSTLEIAASIATENGVFHEAFDATGQSLWPALTGINFAVPVVADFDRDGDVEIYAPDDRTFISAAGIVDSNDGGGSGFNILQPITDLDQDGIPERLSFDNSWRFGRSEIFSTQRWGTTNFRNQTNNFSATRLWQSALFLDVDHDGDTEIFSAGVFGTGLWEAAGRGLPLATRRYSQVVDFDQPVIGFDTDFGTPQNPGLPDSWVGLITLTQIDEQNFTLSAEIRNKGLAPINSPVTVRFYSGRTDSGQILGEVTLSDLPVAAIRTPSITLTDIDLATAAADLVLSAEIVLDPSVVQCDDRNESVEGEWHTIEMRDGTTPYRINRFSYLHTQWYANRDVSFANAPTNTTIELGQTYVFDFDAVLTDPESNIGNSIIYRPSGATLALGMSVNALTGEIQWTPTFANVGVNSFTITAESVDDAAARTFTIDVVPRANEVPVITTTPPGGLVLLGQTFLYDVDATDADADPLTYALNTAPAGMTINALTGEIAWAPDNSQIGLFPVTVTVDDLFGGVATQSFSIQVGSPTNIGPDITSAPPPTAKATFLYQYQVVANDPDGDFLTYTVETGPAGMTIDGNGLLSWTPAAPGMENVLVRVSDGQAFVQQGWTLQISDASVPLEASIGVSPSVADLDTSVQITVGYSGAAGPVSISLTVDGNPVPVDSSGIVNVLADTVGLHTATAIVTDPFASDSATVMYTVIDPALGSNPPVVTLVTPDFEQEVTAPIDAIGTVDDPDDDLISWFLALQPRGAPPTEFTTIASGTDEIPNDVIGQIDPTMLLNGLYSVILQATDAAGNTSQDVRVIRVTGDLKVGNFSITFEDFSAPVAGIPVTVQRTYDTRQRSENLDFGFGWTVDYQNVRLQESRDIGFSWTLIEEDLGIFSQWCVRPNGDPTVTVRMPDGEVESFVARAVPECTFLVPTVDVTIAFDPIDGTDSTLEQTDFGLLRIVGTNIVDLGAPGEPIDPDAYRLTTPEGIVFELDQSFGVRRVIDTHDNTLTYSDAGIIHSQGFALDFIRDAQGRITDVIAPDGTSMTYDYDVNGDLISFTDQVDNVTQFTYTNTTEHFLEDIIDPRGIRVSRNEYDANGRLEAIIDASGNRIEYTHDVDGRTETVRDRRSNPTIYVYDDEGNILTETNALGETIVRTYDEDRNVLSMTNDLSETTSWTYDLRGNQLTETDALMYTVTRTYDTRNLPLTVVDQRGILVLTNAYDPNNTNLLSQTDIFGNVTTYFWDAAIGTCSTGASRGVSDRLDNRTTIQPQCVGPFAELPAWEDDARGVRRNFGYDDVGQTISETTTRTDEFGVEQTLVTTMEYDDKGRLFRVTDPENNVTVTEYNAIDKVSSMIDANLQRTQFDYDPRGNLILTIYPDGTPGDDTDNPRETVGYDAEDNVISRTDRLGRTTRMTYDAANRLVATVYPDETPGDDTDNPRTTNEYDTAGRLTATIDELGNRTILDYDDAGQRTLVRDALLNETRFEYNERGLKTAMIDALNRRTIFVYDDANRLVETIFPDDTPGDLTDNLRTIIGYDDIDRTTSESDLAGLITQFEYDEIGNLTAVIDVLSQSTTYGYDEQSYKVSQTDAEDRITTWSYDNAGRVTSRTLPGGQAESFSYDNEKNRIGQIDFNGASHSFGFDEQNRRELESYADGQTVTTTYTLTDLVQSITDSRGTTSYTYDVRDRLTTITHPNGKSITYTYDDAGNRTSLTTINQQVTYGYDALNRIETVTDETGVTTYRYDPVGNQIELEYPNGTRTNYGYDLLDRLTQIEHFDPLGAVVDRHSYTLGPNGNRLQHAELQGRVVDFSYDDLYRLTEEDVTDPDIGDRLLSWTYDAVGNRFTQDRVDITGTTTTTYSFDENDRILSETQTGAAPGSTAFTYDDNGNRLTQTDGTTTTFEYDSRNRLVSVNGGEITYAYDALGIRQSETVAGSTTQYLVDENRDFAQVIEESNNLDTIAETRYTHGDDLIHQHRRVDATTTDSITYHFDGIGSTRLTTDRDGAAVDTYVYEAFGDMEASSGSSQNDYLFAGEQYDSNVDLYYLRARYYDPGIGQFDQIDHWDGQDTDPATLHKYAYAHNNPISNTDPSGLQSLSETQIASNVNATLRTGRTANFKVIRTKAKCFIVTKLTDEVIDRGVYIFLDGLSGLPYVGQTGVDFGVRIAQHVAEMKRTVSHEMAKFHFDDDIEDKVIRELEQVIIDIFGEPGKPGNSNKTLSNDINSVNKKKRETLRKTSQLCKK